MLVSCFKKPLLMMQLCIFLCGSFCFAVPTNLTFQSKIFKPDGTPLEAAAVSFRFTSVDPTGTCVLYVEDFANQNMMGTAGLIIFILGSGAKVFPAGLYTYTDIFNNLQTSFSCQGGGTYSPNVAHTDARKLLLQFNDGSGSGW